MNTQDPTDVLQDPALFGREWAEDYDVIQPVDDQEVVEAIDKLAELAGHGPILEVAAGTGRIALPLAKRGLNVTATDASDAMLSKLREKDTNGLVKTRVDVLPRIGGTKRFALICNLLNSIWVMPTADEQRLSLRNAAKHLEPEARLVIEMGVANPQTWVEPLTVMIGSTHVTRTTFWNPVSQKLVHRFTFFAKPGAVKEIRDTALRVIFPQELLLMAELEGLKAESVWSDWTSSPFATGSRNMIAVFKRSRSFR